jgi:hypothetical protein
MQIACEISNGVWLGKKCRNIKQQWLLWLRVLKSWAIVQSPQVFGKNVGNSAMFGVVSYCMERHMVRRSVDKLDVPPSASV